MIDFVYDYYAYDGTYSDSYLFGDPWTYYDGVEIGNVYLRGQARATYLFRDIYNQEYWTPPVP